MSFAEGYYDNIQYICILNLLCILNDAETLGLLTAETYHNKE